jgi:hypothetical protein
MKFTKSNSILPVANPRYPLLNFLQEELALSPDSLAVAERSVEEHHGSLPMVLWQYGLISLEDLDRIYDWLEQF